MHILSKTIMLAALTAPVMAQAQQITGAGSTFGAPIYSKWAEAAKPSTGISLNYQAIGSGAGINQINNRTVDFGASDMPVKPDDLVAHKLMQFPTVVGGVVIIVNLPNIKPDELKLTGDLVADIYLGKITKWNDKKIEELNPGLKLPSTAIAPVYRADGSGTTFVFTDYLSMVNPDWKSQVGASTSVKWVAGSGAKGSDGVDATVRNIKGGIGYVESAYAIQNKLTTTQMKNKDGQFVSPTMESFQSSAAAADWSKVQNFAIDLNDQPGAKSWPIESATFVLIPTDPANPAQNEAVEKFFTWGFKDGNKIATDLLYVPLPDSVHSAIEAAWKTMTAAK
jgi:phosphate transport system substrate-binding protein